MYFFYSAYNNPYYNSAIEEFFLRSRFDDILMVYFNNPSIVCGRFQNINSEINHRFVYDNRINLVRRLSGGGTVYHDPGNLNYAFIGSGKGNIEICYQVITHSLEAIGCNELSCTRSNFFNYGLKISGTAVYSCGDRYLVHGTLLIDADLKKLDGCLSISESYFSRAVKSTPSKTKNVISISNADYVADRFISVVREKTGAVRLYDLTNSDIASIKEKVLLYESDGWIYGNCPTYVFSKRNRNTTVYLKTEKGIITKSEVTLEGQRLNSLFLKGKYHKYSTIIDYLKKCEAYVHEDGLVFSFF